MTSFIGKNSIQNLSDILKKENAKRVLIFTGKKSYEKIKQVVENELKEVEIQYYNDFSTNPKKEEIDIAIQKINGEFDIILAIGGGSVIDFAKAYRYYTKQLKLVAIPTTCGTGSEETQFAVIYIDGIKTSLDNPSILPDYAIVDSQFVENNPKYLKACTALDAYCQAIESYWANKADEVSAIFALEAIKLCHNNIVEYVHTNNSDVSLNMAKASNLAGKAINISRTTAAHALSYFITTKYGIPHGHAVALSMVDLFLANFKIDKLNCIHPSGVDFVKEKIIEICNALNLNNPSEFRQYWYNLLEAIEIEHDFKKLNIIDTQEIVKSVNLERLKNNPKELSGDIINFYRG